MRTFTPLLGHEALKEHRGYETPAIHLKLSSFTHPLAMRHPTLALALKRKSAIKNQPPSSTKHYNETQISYLQTQTFSSSSTFFQVIVRATYYSRHLRNNI